MILYRNYASDSGRHDPNDSIIFAQVASDILNSHLKNWAGKSLSSCSPEVILEYIEAALNKHMPLPEDKEEPKSQEA